MNVTALCHCSVRVVHKTTIPCRGWSLFGRYESEDYLEPIRRVSSDCISPAAEIMAAG